MADFKEAIDKTKNKPFTIFHDPSSYWVKSAQLNPISMDWAEGLALSNNAVSVRLQEEMIKLKGKIIINNYQKLG